MRVVVHVLFVVVLVVTGENKVNSSLSLALARLEFDKKKPLFAVSNKALQKS